MEKPAKPTKNEFLLAHPSDPTHVIAYGWKGPLGYYAALFVSGTQTATRESVSATHKQARDELVAWAIELGFFTLADLDEVSAALDEMAVSKLPKRLHTLVDFVHSFART
jgi:hypothetical protein